MQDGENGAPLGMPAAQDLEQVRGGFRVDGGQRFVTMDLFGQPFLPVFTSLEAMVPQVAGVADAVREAGIPCFGPSREAALIEGSKTFARGFISDADGPTAEAEGVFITPAWAREIE